MSVLNFIQTIWSKTIQDSVEMKVKLVNDCNTKYQGDCKFANTVKILAVGEPTVSGYHGEVNYEDMSDASQSLLIAFAEYFAFKVKDIDKAQSVPGLPEKYQSKASTRLAQRRDINIGRLVAGKAITTINEETATYAKTADTEVLVPVNTIKNDDEIIVRVSNIIPFDGVVTHGEAMVNQASLTGESEPVRRGEGTSVFAGTVVEEGEIVFTSLTKEAFPIIRYRTGDISRIYTQKCACGRTHYRLARIEGRSDDMLIIRGVNVYPSQIEHELLSVEGIEPHYQLVVSKQGVLDTLEVQVEVSQRISSGDANSLSSLSNHIRKKLESSLGISVFVSLMESGTIARSEGKANRIIRKVS